VISAVIRTVLRLLSRGVPLTLANYNDLINHKTMESIEMKREARRERSKCDSRSSQELLSIHDRES